MTFDRAVAFAIVLILVAAAGTGALAWKRGLQQGTCDFCSWRNVRSDCSCKKRCLSEICPRKVVRTR